MRMREKLLTGIERTPPVGRPRGPAWRLLQSDGIVWEGQVLLVGVEVDLAARLIVTHRRLAFVRGGAVVLELPRTWLRPAPILEGHGTVVLTIASPDHRVVEEPETVTLRMRDGHPAAGHLIAMLAGSGARRVLPDLPTTDDDEFVRLLPPLPDIARRDPLSVVDELVSLRRDLEAELRPDSWADLPPAPRESARQVAASAATIEPVVRQTSPPVSLHPDRDWNLRPIKDLAPKTLRRRRSWNLRFGGLIGLLALAAILGAVGLPLLSSRAPVAIPPSADTDGDLPPATISATAPPTATVVDNAEAAALQTAIALGVGGASVSGGLTSATVEQAALLAPATPPITNATSVPDAAVTATRIPETPTEVVATPTATATMMPTPSPTPSPTAASDSTPSPTSAPSVSPAIATAQTLVVGPFRETIELAARGATLPRFGLPAAPDGEWIALILAVRNDSERPAPLAMSDFQLMIAPDGQVVGLDAKTDAVASLIGLDLTAGSADIVQIEPGQTRRLALVFRVPVGSDQVIFRHGTTALDLASSLAVSRPLADLAREPGNDVPELVEARVLRTIDGQRIVVELAGAEIEVRYFGITAPVGDECFGTDATALNAGVVAGQTVWLETPLTDQVDGKPLRRDVWVSNPDGSRFLVAARLVELGAALPDPTATGSAYASWLAATAALAHERGVGLWAACPAEAATLIAEPERATRLGFRMSERERSVMAGPR